VGDVRVGGACVPLEQALSWAEDYLTGRNGTWAYPAYDTYQGGGEDDRISDADLLAPALLNVNRITLQAYYALQKVRGRLEEILQRIPKGLNLDAEPDVTEHIDQIGELFSVLDRHGLPDVRGTILAKILHRKRPAFIPLYDANICYCYRDARGAPIPHDRDRTWQKFARLLAGKMRDDLRTQSDVWNRIVDLAQAAPITRLRALDIIAASGR
jgi:Family of unknown function (DUF6308)